MPSPTAGRTAVAERLPLALRAYRLLTAAAAPAAPLLLSRRLRRGKENAARMHERRGITPVQRPAGPLVWVHGASVGELSAVFPLIERIGAQGLPVLVTSGTVTSAMLARERLGPGAIHQFIPLDTPRFVQRFLDHWRPNLAIFVESDLWPNLILGSAQARMPLIIVNGRVSERSFQRWRAVPRAAAALLGHFDLCLAQSALDADRFGLLGAKRVEVVGNLKLDVPAPPVDAAQLAALKAAIGAHKVIAATSTHPGEEEAMIEAHRRVRQNVRRLLTILAPRQPQRGRGIADLAKTAGLKAALRSQGQLPDSTTDVYIADTMGELGLVYSVAPIVFVGGSLAEHGGQNPIEAIKLGSAVLHGPNVWNFAEIYAALDAAGGAEEVANAQQLTARIGTWLTDEPARARAALAGAKTIDRLGGALARTMTALEPYLLQLRIERETAHA
jgi:3-deoxy-D-manno-octulosonic-acid transferase